MNEKNTFKKESFGLTKTAAAAYLYTLKNDSGMTAKISDYGAALVSLIVPDKNNVPLDVVLGYDDVKGYESGDLFLGGIIGRCANRTKNASFVLNQKTYTLDKNEGENNLHSGFDFYNKRLWSAENISSNSITLSLESPSMDQGFPGNAKISVNYCLTNKNELVISYKAFADEDTVFNLTNHSYFNLNGVLAASGRKITTVCDHEVLISADFFTPTGKDSVPTGTVSPVKNTPMDFTSAKKIGRDINSDFPALTLAKGYDHNWVINGEGFRKAAQMYSPKSGILMQTYTDLPGIQFYTSNYVDNEVGKGGAIYPFRCAACFESQFFPDSINHENFKSPVVKAQTFFETKTAYIFSIF